MTLRQLLPAGRLAVAVSAAVLGIAAAVLWAGVPFALATGAHSGGDGSLALARSELKPLRATLTVLVKQVDAGAQSVGHQRAGASAAELLRTLGRLGRSELRVAARFPRVYGVPYLKTFTELACIGDQVARSEAVVGEREQRGSASSAMSGSGYELEFVLARVREAAGCASSLERQLLGVSGVPRHVKRQLRAVNASVAGLVRRLSGHALGRLPADALQRLGSLERSETRLVLGFPATFGFAYAGAFAPLQCIDSERESAQDILGQFEQRSAGSGRGGRVAPPFAGVAPDLRTASGCAASLERALELKAARTTAPSGQRLATSATSNSMSANPTTAGTGGTVTASWTTVNPTSTDWIGVYATGAANTAYQNWLYDDSCLQTSNGSASSGGSCPIQLPSTPGTYELRLLADNGYTLLATSQTITVNAAALTANPTAVSTGGSVTASWSNVGTPSSTDWIGVYATGAANTAYQGWLYDDSCNQTGNGTTTGGGSCPIRLPTTPGTYELRLFSNNGYTLLATSQTITVNAPTLTASATAVGTGGSVTASWSNVGNPTSTDWIGVYATGAANTAYQGWLYDDSCNQTSNGTTPGGGSCPIRLPTTPGTYELRLFANNGYTLLATSQTITVNAPTLTASATTAGAGATLNAAWNYVGNPTNTDWIGVYATGAANTAYQNWIYDDTCNTTAGATTNTQTSGTCPIQLPTTPGTYELRLFANNGYTVLATSQQITATGGTPVYLDTHYSFHERAADLVSRMTLAEKVAQLRTNSAPAIPRLGVQQYTYWSEGQHGINALGANTNNGGVTGGPRATSFPTNFASTMSWDPQLVYNETTAISDEARGFLDKSLWNTGQNNIGPSRSDYGSLTYFAPTVNMDRDPRWGRTDEAFGEDPYLVSQMAGAFVDGYQGESLSGQPLSPYLKVAATAKHYALNDVENNRQAISSDTNDTDLHDYYTAQFKSLIENSHVAGLMTSLNAINGTPAMVDTYTDNQVAQRTYGFNGYGTSDCALSNVYRTSPNGHDWAPTGWTTDGQDQAASWTNSSTGVQVSGAAGAQAYALRAGTDLNCPGTQATLANVQQAISAGVLSEGVIDDALVKLFTMRMETGEFDPPSNVSYTSITKSVIQSPAHQALARQVADNSLVLLKNGNVSGTSSPLLPVSAARLNKVVILGDLANKVTLGGYSGAPSLQVSAVQGITNGVKAANPNASVVFDAAGTSTTSTTAASLSSQTQQAIQSADLVIVFVGTDGSVASEGHDRSTIAMPGNYDSLISQVAALGNPRMALVIQSDGPVSITNDQPDFPAILFSGYNGESQGDALADVLFGSQNPSGHLNFTWYSDDSQLPPISNYGLTAAATGGLGRTYMYFTGTPTYPFGYGLSYTTFKFSNLQVGQQSVTADGTVQVSFNVTNTGNTPGAAVPQLYVATPTSLGSNFPKKRLEGFQKTSVLNPGQTQTVTFERADLASGVLGPAGSEMGGSGRHLSVRARTRCHRHRCGRLPSGHRQGIDHAPRPVRDGAAAAGRLRAWRHARFHDEEPVDR